MTRRNRGRVAHDGWLERPAAGAGTLGFRRANGAGPSPRLWLGEGAGQEHGRGQQGSPWHA